MWLTRHTRENFLWNQNADPIHYDIFYFYLLSVFHEDNIEYILYEIWKVLIPDKIESIELLFKQSVEKNVVLHLPKSQAPQNVCTQCE